MNLVDRIKVHLEAEGIGKRELEKTLETAKSLQGQHRNHGSHQIVFGYSRTGKLRDIYFVCLGKDVKNSDSGTCPARYSNVYYNRRIKS